MNQFKSCSSSWLSFSCLLTFKTICLITGICFSVVQLRLISCKQKNNGCVWGLAVLCCVQWSLCSSPGPSWSEQAAASGRLPPGRDPRRRRPGLDPTQSHGLLCVLLLRAAVVLRAVTSALLGLGPNEDSALTSAGSDDLLSIPAQLLRAAWGRPALNAGAHSAPKKTQVDTRASLTHCDSKDQVLFNPLCFCSFRLNSSSE